MDDNFYCIFCDELFENPPVEDWIECKKCNLWCHEKCADTDSADVNNNFVRGVC